MKEGIHQQETVCISVHRCQQEDSIKLQSSRPSRMEGTTEATPYDIQEWQCYISQADDNFQYRSSNYSLIVSSRHFQVWHNPGTRKQAKPKHLKEV